MDEGRKRAVGDISLVEDGALSTTPCFDTLKTCANYPQKLELNALFVRDSVRGVDETSECS